MAHHEVTSAFRSVSPAVITALPFLLLVSACSPSGSTGVGGDGGEGGGDGLACTIAADRIAYGGVPRDGIAALTNPTLVAPDDAGADYLRPDDRLITFRIDDRAYAVPHNILWWHEIANLDLGGEELAVTYCPLTGSSLVFDRSVVDGAEFGVSGLLFQNNLMMFDRTDGESLWPQMARAARCGPRSGTRLPTYPAMEMEWERWRELHPDGRVVSSRTRFALLYDYGQYPYHDYEELHNDRLLFPETMKDRPDPRRPPKERVLGIPTGETRGVAIPFGTLEELGDPAAVSVEVDGREVVVFWDGPGRSAAAHRPELDGERLTFEAREGRIVDRETGSRWRVDGLSVEGPLAGRRLEPVAEAYVSFWFAWSAFHLATFVWQPA